MIVPIDGVADGVVAMRVVGQMTVDDYGSVIEPELGRLAALGGEKRLLLHLGPDFTGFGPGAWGDLTSDIRAAAFYRGAVVTDDDFIRRGLRMISWTLRGDVRTFRNRDYHKAVRWVSG